MNWCPTAFAAEPNVAIPEAPNLVTLLLQALQSHEQLHHWLHAWENVIFAWVIAFGLAGALLWAARRPAIIPRPAQNFVEWLVEAFEQLFVGDLGPHTRRFLPFLGTLFLYILAMNWALLVPGLKSPTGGLAVSGAEVISGGFVTTGALAFCVFLFVQYTALRSHGPLAYLHHLLGSPRSAGEWILCVVTLAPVTHILGEVVRPISLALRLFGNITGDDILYGVFLVLGVLSLSAWKLPIGVPLQLLAVPIVLLFGFVQALIFTSLTSAYLGLSLAVEHTHHKGGGE